MDNRTEAIRLEQMTNSNIRQILILDDDPKQIRFLKDLLEHHSIYDLRFVDFTNPRECLDAIQYNNWYDGALVNLNLCHPMNGIEFVQDLRERDNPILCPIIIFSSESNFKVKIQAIQNTRDMVKPEDILGDEAYKFAKAFDGMMDLYYQNTQFGSIRHELVCMQKIMVTKDDLTTATGVMVDNITNKIKSCLNIDEVATSLAVKAGHSIPSSEFAIEATKTESPGDVNLTLKNFLDIWNNYYKENPILKIFVEFGKLIIFLVALIIDAKYFGIMKNFLGIFK